MYRLIYYFFMGEFPCKHVYGNYKLISIDAHHNYSVNSGSKYWFSIKIASTCNKCKDTGLRTFTTTDVDSRAGLERDKKFNLTILKKYITSEFGVDFDGADVYVEQ